MRNLIAATLCLVIAVSASAQNCSTLAVTGSVNAGQTLTIDVSGATANAATFLFIGSTAGSTTINVGPLGSFTIDLNPPFLPLPMGQTDAAGHVALSVIVPANVPANAIPNHTFTVQSLSVGFTMGGGSGPGLPTLSFCTSNSGTVVSGTG